MTINYNILKELKGDRGIWIVLFLLAIASVLSVYSSTFSLAFQDAGGNTEYYIIKHVFILLLSLGLAIIAYLIPYRTYAKIAPVLIVLAIILLCGTLLFGSEYNEAKRWLKIPIIGMRFQPSEFAKIALIIFVATRIASKQDTIKNLKESFLPILVPIILVCFLILPEDLSTAGLLFFTSILMMFIGRVDMKYILALLIIGLVFLGLFILVGMAFPELSRLSTWTTRLNDFWYNLDGGYQIQQSKIAIAHGNWTGVGPGNSLQRNFLPYPYADFIYAIICEEYGLLGALTIIGLYFFLLWRVVILVTRTTSTFAAVLAIGLCLNLVIQAFANIAVSVHLVPVTGLTLPLVSMGGTSILITSISIGIILSVSKYTNEQFGLKLIKQTTPTDEDSD